MVSSRSARAHPLGERAGIGLLAHRGTNDGGSTRRRVSAPRPRAGVAAAEASPRSAGASSTKADICSRRSSLIGCFSLAQQRLQSLGDRFARAEDA
jgi:hypothetical protein